MPRQKDEIWKQYEKITLSNGSISSECKICKDSVVGLVSRLKTQFEQSTSFVGINVEAGYTPPILFVRRLEWNNSLPWCFKAPRQRVIPFQPANKQIQHEVNLQITRQGTNIKLVRHVIKCLPELTIFDRTHCNVLIVSLFIIFTLFRCIVATGSPIRMTENKQFKALVQKLGPRTEVPSR